jgi:hypothetical protein
MHLLGPLADVIEAVRVFENTILLGSSVNSPPGKAAF